MDGRIGELLGGNGIPQIEIGPAVLSGLSRQKPAILIIGPARVKTVVADVAVLTVADEHGFIHQQHGQSLRPGHPRGQHIERQHVLIELRGLFQVLPTVILLEIGLPQGDIIGNGLINPCGGPRQPQALQTHQIGQGAALPDDGALSKMGINKAGIVGIQIQIILGDEPPHPVRVVLQQGVIQLAGAGEGFEGHRPEHEIGRVGHGLVQQHEVFGKRHDRITQIVEHQALPLPGGVSARVQPPRQRIPILEKPAPGGRIPDNQHPELIPGLGLHQDVAVEHGRDVVQGEVVALGGVFTIGQPQPTGPERVVEGKPPKRLQGIRPGEDRVGQDEKEGRFQRQPRQHAPGSAAHGIGQGDGKANGGHEREEEARVRPDFPATFTSLMRPSG